MKQNFTGKSFKKSVTNATLREGCITQHEVLLPLLGKVCIFTKKPRNPLKIKDSTVSRVQILPCVECFLR